MRTHTHTFTSSVCAVADQGKIVRSQSHFELISRDWHLWTKQLNNTVCLVTGKAAISQVDLIPIPRWRPPRRSLAIRSVSSPPGLLCKSKYGVPFDLKVNTNDLFCEIRLVVSESNLSRSQLTAKFSAVSHFHEIYKHISDSDILTLIALVKF